MINWNRNFSRAKSDRFAETKLAIVGGAPAVTDSLPPMYPGGMRIGANEEKAVLDLCIAVETVWLWISCRRTLTQHRDKCPRLHESGRLTRRFRTKHT